MCLGVPMLVLERLGALAVCERGDERRTVSCALVGDVEVGAHVLVHVDTALRVLDAAEAALVEDAISALEAASAGRSLDGFFSDLVNREPELPPHLRPENQTKESKSR